MPLSRSSTYLTGFIFFKFWHCVWNSLKKSHLLNFGIFQQFLPYYKSMLICINLTSIWIYLHQFVILHQSVSFLMKIRFWIISWNIVAKNRIQFSCLCSSSSNQFQILGICPKAIWPFCNAYFCKPIWIQSCL